MAMTLTADFQEKKQHGSVLFPFNIYPLRMTRRARCGRPHWRTSRWLI